MRPGAVLDSFQKQLAIFQLTTIYHVAIVKLEEQITGCAEPDSNLDDRRELETQNHQCCRARLV